MKVGVVLFYVLFLCAIPEMVIYVAAYFSQEALSSDIRLLLEILLVPKISCKIAQQLQCL